MHSWTYPFETTDGKAKEKRDDKYLGLGLVQAFVMPSFTVTTPYIIDYNCYLITIINQAKLLNDHRMIINVNVSSSLSNDIGFFYNNIRKPFL